MPAATSKSAKKTATAPVSIRALTQRINRVLAKRAELMKVARGRAEQELGRFYIIDSHNHIVDGNFDLAEKGRELGVLRDFEHLVAE
jgi:ribose 5-phosphate isomerase